MRYAEGRDNQSRSALDPKEERMKHRMMVILGVAALAIALPSLHAQARLIANVPFDFYMEQKTLPAGSYEVLSISNKVDLIQNTKTDDASFLIRAVHIQAVHDHGPMTIFHKYGSQYFLSEIWDG